MANDVVGQAPAQNFTMAIDSEAVLICPICGDTRGMWGDCLDVTIPLYEGKYCIKCWAKWISENIPKMEKKP